jgi:hypothetical protein
MHLLLALALLVQDTSSAAVDTTGAFMTNAGVVRAAGVVDSVFVTRLRDSATVDAGDWTAYLMARLGVGPIPSMGLRVTIDTARLHVHGRLRDIPAEAQLALSDLLAMLDPATPIEATVVLDRVSPNAIRFHLEAAWISGFPVPEAVLAPGLRVVGEKYPVLANGGRDLFVETPVNARIEFSSAGVRLIAPPRTPPPKPRRRVRHTPPRPRPRPR